VGVGSVFFVALLTCFLSYRWPKAAVMLWCAFTIRFGVILFNNFVAPLPDSEGDAQTFERIAWALAQSGFWGVLDQFEGPRSNFISWVIALFYSIFGRSLVLAQSFSLLCGMGAVFLGWLLAKRMWGSQAASRAGWVLALFPSLILYSTLVLRESYVWFFLLVAMHGVLGWARSGSFRAVLLAMIGFICATFFHGAIAIGAVVFILLVFVSSLKKTSSSAFEGRLIPSHLFILIVSLAVLTFYIVGKPSIPKIGTFEQAVDISYLLKKASSYSNESKALNGAGYPSWTKISSPYELIYKVPLKMIYFLFSPFPWDVHKIKHVLGMLDSFFYMLLVALIWKNRKRLWEDKGARTILIILMVYIFVFGFIVGNFGTAIRHRAKFITILIVLASPFLPRVRLFSRR
jgi:4-amino-4-deoxy-L-arabinose transferase-like glycosyltransferase